MRKDVSRSQRPQPNPPQEGFLELVRAIVAGDATKAARLLAASPDLAHERAVVGATRESAAPWFFEAIAHYMYGGDSALHMAAASFRHEICRDLIARGADGSAANRRGAQPLHYAADANTWNPDAQAATIDCLIRARADPNATDNSGVPPLHRAVRTRSAAAVAALLAGGAQARSRNRSGSTPLHLAVQNTGRGGSGSPRDIAQQREIILILLQSGAQPDDRDGQGKAVRDVKMPEWIRALLQTGAAARRC
jgi:ankyrin repeat protein